MLNGGYGYAYPANMRKSRPTHQAQALDHDSPRHPPIENLNNAHPPTIAKLYKRELPNSQESFVSTASSTYTAPPLLSSSNVSNSTAADTDITSPPSSNVPSSQSQPPERALPPSPTQVRGQNVHPPAPRIDTTPMMRTGDTAASPMSVDSPVTQGSKRTADGTLKGTGPTVGSSVEPAPTHKRNKSMGSESTANPRIGELSAQLKTRLSYAMVKVQNGWEKQSLEELEDLSSQRGSPNSAPDRSENSGSRPTFESPRSVERRRRPSGVSDNSDQMMMSPAQPSPANRSNNLAPPSSFWRFAPKPQVNSSINLMAVTGTSPMLAPSAEIGSRRKRRASASHHPPPLLSATHQKHYSDLGAMTGTPRTPTTAAVPRAGILRMPSHQAEKDAVDTLLFMSSPNNSGRLPHTGMDAPQPSPLRSEMPRRVMFDTNATKDKVMASPQPRPEVNHQHAAYYRADPARR